MKTWPRIRFVSTLLVGYLLIFGQSVSADDHAQKVLSDFRKHVAKSVDLSDKLKASVEEDTKRIDRRPRLCDYGRSGRSISQVRGGDRVLR